MVGAEVSITPPVRGAASGAPGGSALNVREGRGHLALVAGVQVPAEAERPSVVPVGALAVLVTALRGQQVIPHEILIQLRVLVLLVAVLPVVSRRGRRGRRGRGALAGSLRGDRDGDGLALLANEPAPLVTRGDTCSRELKTPVNLHGPLRLPNIPRAVEDKRVRVRVFIFPLRPLRLGPPLQGHGGLQVDHLEFLLRQSLLQPLQVGLTRLQLRLDVLHRLQVHARHFSVGEFIPPVFGKFLLFPHVRVLTAGCDQPRCGAETVRRRRKLDVPCLTSATLYLCPEETG